MKTAAKITSIITAVLIFMSSLAFSVSAANVISESESNDTYGSANTLGANQTISGSLSDSNDKDYFKFTASETGTAEFIFNHNQSDGDGYWHVILLRDDGNDSYNTINNIYIYKNKSSGTSVATIGLTASHSYYIYISGPSSIMQEPYSVTCEFTARDDYETDFNDTYLSADTLDANSEIYANLSTGDDEDYFKFTAPETGKAVFTFNHNQADGEVYWHVILLRDDGNDSYSTINNIYVYKNKSSNTVIATIGLTEGQSYYVYVSGPSGIAQYEYSVNCTFTATNNYETEYNGTYLSADTLKENSAVWANLTTGDDNDYFKFTASKSETLNFVFAHNSEDSDAYWKVSVIKDEGNDNYSETASQYVYLSDSESTTIATITVSASDTYYIVVNGSSHIGQNPYLVIVSDGTTVIPSINDEATGGNGMDTPIEDYSDAEEETTGRTRRNTEDEETEEEETTEREESKTDNSATTKIIVIAGATVGCIIIVAVLIIILMKRK